MSFPLVVWVMKHSPAKLGERLVLLALAEFAHDDGTKAFPSVSTLMERANMSRRGVQDALRRLEADVPGRGPLIVRTGQTASGTAVYRLVLSEGGADSARGGADEAAEGARMSARGGAAPAPDPGERTLEQGPPPAIKIDGRFRARDKLAAVCGVEEGSPRERSLDAALNGSREVGPGIRRLVWERAVDPRFRDAWAAAARGEAPRGLTATEEQERLRVDFDEIVVREIVRRARAYRERFSADVELTPTALAKWFVDVATPRRGGVGANLSGFEEPFEAIPEVSEEERREQAARIREMAAGIGLAVDDAPTRPDGEPLCESCRAPIVWAVTEKGKRQPFDREPVAAGSVLLRHVEAGKPPTSHVVRKAERAEMEAQAAARGETLRLFMPHHATCPNAAQHRRRSG